MNPFDLPGSDFFALFFVVWIVTFVAACAFDIITPRPRDAASLADVTSAIDTYSIAYLIGGETLTIKAALVRLLAERALSLDEAPAELKVIGPGLPRAHAVEIAVFDSVRKGSRSRDLKLPSLRADAVAPLDTILGELEYRGLLSRTLGTIRFLIASFPALFGVIRMLIGEPVLDLGALCLLSVVLAFHVFPLGRPLRTRCGKAVIERLQEQHAALRASEISRDAAADPKVLALAVALFGLPVLAVSEFAKLEGAIESANPKSSGFEITIGGD